MSAGYGLTGVRVAFFRNLNLGQRRSHSPTAAELLDAFARAGCPDAAPFGSNGTVIFRACGGTENARAAARLLGDVCGYADVVMVRSARWVVDLAARLDPDLPDGEVHLFDGHDEPGLPLPWTHSETGLLIVELTRRHAVTSWPVESPTGSPAHRVLASLTGVPVSGRGVRTMLRLARRLTDAPGPIHTNN